MSMESPIIIGLAGRARSGKNTVAQCFDEVIPLEFVVRTHAFADPLREALLRLNPMVAVDFDGKPLLLQDVIDDADGWENIKYTKYGPEIRRLLQRFGTESIRHMDNEFWVRQTMERIYRGSEIAFNVGVDMVHVVTDVRFANEAYAIQQSMQGVIVEVINDELLPPNDTHSSEIIDFKVDYQIHNRPSEGYRALQHKVEDLWAEIKEGVI